MRTRMYGGVRGRKTKVGGKPTFVFLLLDYSVIMGAFLSKLYILVVKLSKIVALKENLVNFAS